VAVRRKHLCLRESIAHLRLELGREADLRHHQQGLSSAPKRFRDEVEVNLRLAAASDALQEQRMKPVEAAGREIERVALVLGQRMKGAEAAVDAGLGNGGGNGSPVDLPQSRGQPRRGHFAQSAMVIARAEAEERELRCRKRWDVRDQALDVPHAGFRELAAGGATDDHADFRCLPERHRDQRPKRHIRIARPEIERLVEWQVERDADDRMVFQASGKSGCCRPVGSSAAGPHRGAWCVPCSGRCWTGWRPLPAFLPRSQPGCT
jgi:hypothetical protein